MRARVGAVGGTFTDVILQRAGGTIRLRKVPSTPPHDDAGGAGRYRGGLAIERSWRALTSRILTTMPLTAGSWSRLVATASR